jgi:hypothetical protein
MATNKKPLLNRAGEYVADNMSTGYRKIVAGITAAGIMLGASVAEGAKQPTKSTASTNTETLYTAAQNQAISLGTRIIKIAHNSSSTGIKRSIIGLYKSNLEQVKLIRDVAGPSGQSSAGEYKISAIIPRDRKGKLDVQNIQSVNVTEGIKNNATFVSLSFLKDVKDKQGGWDMVGSYLQSYDPYSSLDNEPKTIRAATRPNLFGISQPRITVDQLTRLKNQANLIITRALDSKPVSLMPLAFQPVPGENTNP